MKLTAIVSVDPNWGIGYDGHLLEIMPEDMQNFKIITNRNIVIMGRKTLESLPDSKPLSNRINIIFSKSLDHVDNAFIVHSIDELKSLLSKFNLDNAYVIGGSSIYELLLPYCKEALITTFIKCYNEVDSYFPNLNICENWNCDSRRYSLTSNPICAYEKWINNDCIELF